MTLAELAQLLHGTCHGDPELDLTRLSAPGDEAAGCLVCAFNAAGVRAAEAGGAAAVVLGDGLETALPHVRVAEPKTALFQLQVAFEPPLPPSRGVHPTALVEPGARLGAGVEVGAFTTVAADAVLGDGTRIGARCSVGAGVTLGTDCLVADNVVLYPGTRLGDRVRLSSGVVVGAPGFGYRFAGGRHERVPQLGAVVLEDDVEVGANSCIDRAAVGVTRIGAGTKIDNLVQIGHNVRVGRHCVLVAQVGVGGSSTLGDYVVLAGQVGVADHRHIGDAAQVGGQAGVLTDVPPRGRYFGTPAVPDMQCHRMVAATRRLPEALKSLRILLRRAGLEGDDAS